MGLIDEDQLALALKIQKESLTFSDDVEARKLAQIIQLGSIVNSTLNISEVLHNVMELANGVTNAVASTLMLLDQDTGELVFSVPTGPKSDELTDVRIPPGKGIAGWVAEHRQPLLIPDVGRDERFFPNIDKMVGFKTESILCVPLQSKGRLIGVLEAINKEDQGRFDKEDELMLGIFATQAAMAIENARLYSEVNLHLEELQEKQRSLEESEFKYRTVSEMTSDFSFCYKNDGRGGFFLEWITDAFKAVTGYDQDRFNTNPDCLEIFHPDDREKVREIFNKACQGASGGGKFRLLAAGGETIWLKISYHPLESEDGSRVERIVGVAREITAQVKAREEKEVLERMFRQSQKMEALGTLTGGIAHDFNNILQAISGSAQLIARQEKTGEIAKYVAQIESSTQRAVDLVTRLLTFSRDMKPKLAPLDLNHELAQVRTILKQTFPRMIVLENDLAQDLPPIKGDSNQIHHLVLNLAANARDAMPQGGVLRFSTQKVFLDQDALGRDSDLCPGEYVRLVVSDNGVGMDRATRRKAFEPFFTTKEVGKGTGLGLSSVYGIVQSHGGRIDCTSALGQGTSFAIDLPVSDEAVSRGKRKSGEEQRKHPGGSLEKILIVDDEPLVLDISREFLEQSGFRGPDRGHGRAGPGDVQVRRRGYRPDPPGPEHARHGRPQDPGADPGTRP